MEIELYYRKIQHLTDDKLKELLQLRTKENAEIMQLAEHEAIKRGINPETIKKERNTGQIIDQTKKEGVNWLSILTDLLS